MRSRFLSFLAGAAFVGVVPVSAWAQDSSGNTSVGEVGSTGSLSGTTTAPATAVPVAEPAPVGPPTPQSTAGTGVDNMVSPTDPNPAPVVTPTTPAEPYYGTTPVPSYTDDVGVRTGPSVYSEDLYARGPASGFGAALSIGGGVQNFVGSTARENTDVGGSWGANLTLGTRTPAALELGYIGGANALNVTGLDNDALMLQNGAQAALRLNGRVMAGTTLIQPFAFGGGAWQRITIVNDTFNTSSIRGGDDVFSVPFGGGVATAYRGFYMEGRFTYRPTFDENFFGGSDLTSWNAGVNLGAEF